LPTRETGSIVHEYITTDHLPVAVFSVARPAPTHPCHGVNFSEPRLHLPGFEKFTHDGRGASKKLSAIPRPANPHLREAGKRHGLSTPFYVSALAQLLKIY